MGLDVTAYSCLQKVDALYNQYGEPVDPLTREVREDVETFHINPHFPGRAGSIEDGASYKFNRRKGLSAGSYGWYNGWRERLAKLAGYPTVNYHGHPSHQAAACQAESGPFWELICFSDCEGVIGTAACAKLAKDFSDFQDLADAVTDPHFATKYKEWREVFELAADNGAVEFH